MLCGKFAASIVKNCQSLTLFRPKQIFIQIFFIQLLSTWVHLTNNNFPNPTSIEKTFD